jgi:hypothetical protein
LNVNGQLVAVGDETFDRQYRALLSFDTSTLPADAVFSCAYLKIWLDSVVGTNPLSTFGWLWLDIRQPFFGSNIGLALNDFQIAANVTKVGAMRTTTVNGWYISRIRDTGYPYINKDGTTQLRLYFAMDDNDNGIADYLKFRSGNYAQAAYRPTLVIEYYVP